MWNIGVVKLLPRGVAEGSNIGRTEGARGAVVLVGAEGAETTPPGAAVEVEAVVVPASPPAVDSGASKHRV